MPVTTSTQHRSTWAELVARAHWLILFGWLGMIWVAWPQTIVTPDRLSANGLDSQTEAAQTDQVVRKEFSQLQSSIVLTLILHSGPTSTEDPAYRAQVAAWRADLQALVASPSSVDFVAGQDHHTVGFIVRSRRSPDDFVQLAHKLSTIHHRGPAEEVVGGPSGIYDAFVRDSGQDLRQSELISIVLVPVILLFVFRGVVAGLVPLLTGATAACVAIAVLGVAAKQHHVSVFALNITWGLSFGLGIDYSLLIVSRFREELGDGRSAEEKMSAVVRTVRTAGAAAAVSGGTVAVGFGALLLSHTNVLWSLGLGGVIVVLVTVAASLTFTPSLLVLFGRHVNSLTLPFASIREPSPRWGMLVKWVTQRSTFFIGATLFVILIVGSQVRTLNVGVQGLQSLPADDPASRAESLARTQLGLGTRSPTVVLVRGATTTELAAQVAGLLPHASDRVPGPVTGAGGDLVWLLDPPGDDNSPATREWLDHMRHAPWPKGVTVQFGGSAAGVQDLRDLTIRDLWQAVGLVVSITLVLVGVAFRSITLAIKAVAMNALSVLVALGLLTWGFQDGHLAGLLRFQATGFVDATIPTLIVAGLFGLSMDYEIFLLSRIRDRWQATDDSGRAVEEGTKSTGRVITSAALILVMVVGSLAFSRLAPTKAAGITFATAIAFDATVIRLILTPALMQALGSINWWPSVHGRPATLGRMALALAPIIAFAIAWPSMTVIAGHGLPSGIGPINPSPTQAPRTAQHPDLPATSPLGPAATPAATVGLAPSTSPAPAPSRPTPVLAPSVAPTASPPAATPPPDKPVVVGTGTYREGELVYASISYTDADGDAEGFGFRGVNGSGWAPESHPFSSPSYGRVSPGRVDYPFNQACGQPNQYDSSVEFWIYDMGGRVSNAVVVHLTCS